jgi:acetyl esterase/lipase
MRAEARAAVKAGMDMFSGPDIEPAALSRDERVRLQRAAMPTIPVPEAIERTIEGVQCRMFLPEGKRAPRAVYLHFHGGGMVAGSPETMDIPNRDLARDLDVIVVSPDYRKAPEHPYPAGPDDAFMVSAWLTEHARDELGAERIIIGGESAGGYLTALVALRLRDSVPGAIDRVIGLNLVFGIYDWGHTPSQRGLRPHEGPDLLDPEEIEFVTECYLPALTADERRAPAISPAYADLHGLPPMFLSVGTSDHVVDDTLLLAARAAAAGNRVELFVAPDMPHGFFAFSCAMSKLWAERLNAWLEQVISA